MKFFLLSFSAFLMLLGLQSCQEDAFYSCDPEINTWANDNIKEVKQLNLAEFQDLQTDYQRAAFVAFTPEKKVSIWIAKLDETLLLDWSDAEKTHIRSMQALLSKFSDLYEKDVAEERRDEFFIEAYRWVDYAYNKLGWSKQLIYAMAYRPNKVLSKTGELKMGRKAPASLKTRNETDKEKCECTVADQGEGVIINDCGLSYNGCWTLVECKATTLGCGIWFLENCDGTCH